MTRRDYYFDYLLCQNTIDISKKDMMLLYGGMIIRILHTHDRVIPSSKEIMKL